MKVKKFEGASVEEVLLQVKRHWGPNALILATRQRPGPWFGKPIIEITAAFQEAAPAQAAPIAAPRSSTKRLALEDIFPHRKKSAPEVPAPTVVEPVVVPLPEKRVGTSKAKGFERELLSRGFSQRTAREFSERFVFDYPSRDFEDPSFLERTTRRLITANVRTLTGEILQSAQSWAVIGLPGSGKTSMAVKLAIFLKRQGRDVALVSTDSHKLAGREELAQYAEAIQVPFEWDMDSSSRCAKKVIQLIDTPSLSLTEESRNEEIARICRNRKTILVLDASHRPEEMGRVVEAAHRFNPVAVAFTRLDIISQTAVLFDALKQARLPLLGVSLAHSFKTAFKFFESKEFAEFISP